MLTNLAYPIGDVLLLALVFFVFSVTRWRPGRAWALLAVGLLVVSVGDGVFLYRTATDTYSEGTLLDLLVAGGARAHRVRGLARPGRAPHELQ